MAQFLGVTAEVFNDVRNYFDEAPQAISVFKKILKTYTEKQYGKLKTSKETIDIFRAQGALDIIKNTDKMIENIKGNY